MTGIAGLWTGRKPWCGVGVAALALTLASLSGAATGSAASPAEAGHSGAQVVDREATARVEGNPFVGRPWAVATRGEPTYDAYAAAGGAKKALLAKMALAPKPRWYGDWVAPDVIATAVSRYIEDSQAGDPTALVQMAIFRMVPWEQEACDRLPTSAEQARYKTWIDAFASAVGSTPAAIVLQPDGPFALCAPHGSKIPSKLIRYATKALSSLPATSVYIDAGASDWNGMDPKEALKMLLPAGVEMARGFALNSSHYASTADEVEYGTAVVKALARKGLDDKHFVVNTAANGRPFNGYEYHGPNYDNARACKTRHERRCVTLGIPPTADVANPAWKLPAKAAQDALAYADAYLWIGRPWLYMQDDPFVLSRALQLARTTPY